MNYQSFNPYMSSGFANPYLPAQPQQSMQITKVNGRNGAMQYAMGPNSSAWILDENGLVSWLCITDGAGYKTVTPYDITPHQDAPAPDYGSLEERIKKLEDVINADTRNYSANSKSKPGNVPNPANDKHG